MEKSDSQGRVLIVDDDSQSIKLLRMVLDREMRVETAANGREGLDKMTVGAFDVIVSDIEMPFMTGIELYQAAVAADPAIAERFLFFSASCHPDHIAFIREKGLLHLQKPVSVMRLKEAISRIAAGKTEKTPSDN